MSVTLEKYGDFKGEPLYELTLTNHNGMVVKLLNYGATLEQVLLPEGERHTNVILSLDSPAAYHQERNFLGGTVGRVIGRVPGHLWHRGSELVSLPANEGDNAIHGGDDGLDQQVWNLSYRQETSQDQVTFTEVDFAGHNLYPGNVKVTVVYRLDDDNQLHYDLTATTDAMTLFNATNHVYFALDGADSTVDETSLQLASDYYGPLAANHLPMSGWQPVAGTVFDFREPQKLGTVMSQVQNGAGLDHPFLLNNDVAATLTGASGRQVTMTTTAPAVAVYTANHFNGTGVAHNLHQHNGVTLEAQVAPPSGQDWSALTLMPGQSYHLTTTWAFSTPL